MWLAVFEGLEKCWRKYGAEKNYGMLTGLASSYKIHRRLPSLDNTEYKDNITVVQRWAQVYHTT